VPLLAWPALSIHPLAIPSIRDVMPCVRGGPLLNMNGEVVGINTAIVAQGQGIGFAIPVNLAQTIIAQLKEHGSVTRGWMGVGI
jgi:serine protease Do